MFITDAGEASQLAEVADQFHWLFMEVGLPPSACTTCATCCSLTGTTRKRPRNPRTVHNHLAVDTCISVLPDLARQAAEDTATSSTPPAAAVISTHARASHASSTPYPPHRLPVHHLLAPQAHSSDYCDT